MNAAFLSSLSIAESTGAAYSSWGLIQWVRGERKVAIRNRLIQARRKQLWMSINAAAV